MGNFREEITLVNAGDVSAATRGLAQTQDVRQVTVRAVVDTGATTVVIDEQTRRQLGLAVESAKWTTFANGTRQKCDVTETVIVRWKNRAWNCPAIVIPGAKSILLGAIPLEGMDLKIDVVNRQLERAHGDSWETLALAAR